MGSSGAGAVVTPEELEAFIAESNLDQRAAGCLMSELPDVQKAVMSRGTLADCTNPSSALMGRIKDAKSSLNVSGAGHKNNNILGNVKGGKANVKVEQLLLQNAQLLAIIQQQQKGGGGGGKWGVWRSQPY